jgi:imidazoleglycerol phosphate dehydratase HisB
MAHLKTKATHNDPESRKAWKFRLTTMLYERGYKKQDILELYNFLDYMMTLPESLSTQFDLELEAFEETQKMKYVTTIERRGEARGEAKARSLVQRQLTHRFGELQAPLLTAFNSLTIDQLESLGEALLDFTSIDDLTEWLATHAQS